MALLSHGLLPATFRGAPFAVESDDMSGGRRNVVHQYPGRDEPWTEDMGRAARRYRFRGFIVDGDVLFFGGPIQLQRLLLLAALEKEGPGTLTHPTLGIRNVSVQSFSIGADLGAGRMSQVDIEFVESGKKAFPAVTKALDKLLSASTLAKATLALAAVRTIAAVVQAVGGSATSDITGAAADVREQTTALGADATALHRLAAQLPGDNGRFSAGGNAGLRGATALDPDATIGDAIAQASAARAAIDAAGAGVSAALASFDPDDATPLADAIIALVDALVAACADPADAIRLLAQLAGFAPDGAGTAGGAAVTALYRRAVAAAIVQAAARYQPQSNDDAAAMIVRVATLIDAIATAAADAGDDDVFAALRAARAAVVEDLRTRGATLPKVRTFVLGTTLPSLFLAQRFYRDAGRADQLVAQAQPPHPLFMPTEFRALAA